MASWEQTGSSGHFSQGKEGESSTRAKREAWWANSPARGRLHSHRGQPANHGATQGATQIPLQSPAQSPAFSPIESSLFYREPAPAAADDLSWFTSPDLFKETPFDSSSEPSPVEYESPPSSPVAISISHSRVYNTSHNGASTLRPASAMSFTIPIPIHQPQPQRPIPPIPISELATAKQSSGPVGHPGLRKAPRESLLRTHVLENAVNDTKFTDQRSGKERRRRKRIGPASREMTGSVTDEVLLDFPR